MNAIKPAPQDVKHGFLSVARRMQSVSKTGGLAIITIHVLVNNEGDPQFWTEPNCTKIEPKRSAEEILRVLGRLSNSIDGVA